LLAVFLGCLLSFLLVRPRADLAEAMPDINPQRRWLYRLGCTVLPGAYDLRFGSTLRGCVIAGLACFLFFLGLMQLKLGWPLAGVPGIISGIAVPNVAGSFPLPTPPGAAADARAVWDYHYWTLFWAYPYAKVFWPFAGLCALVVLVYHAFCLPRIWRA
jgi:hypothetical protein